MPDGNTMAWRIVAVDNGAHVGQQCLRRWPECYCLGVLHALEVSPAMRRQGIATELVKRAIECARVNGIALLYTTIIASNVASRGTLEKCGFRLVNECRNPKSGNDLVIYAFNVPNATYNGASNCEE